MLDKFLCKRIQKKSINGFDVLDYYGIRLLIVFLGWAGITALGAFVDIVLGYATYHDIGTPAKMFDFSIHNLIVFDIIGVIIASIIVGSIVILNSEIARCPNMSDKEEEE